MRASERGSARFPISLNLTLAYRNLLRHSARSATTLVAIAFGVAALILSQGFVEDIFLQLGEAIIHSQTGHMQLAAKDYFSQGAQRPEKYLMSDPEGDKQRLRSLPEVADVMARLNFSGLLNNGRADLPILGEAVEPGPEAKLGTFLSIKAGRLLNERDHYSAVLGQGVAQALGLAPGDRAVLIVSTAEGAANTLDLEVVGIFQSFSKEYDNRAVKIPLSAAQELLATTGASALVISLHRTADTDRVSRLLKERTVWRGQEVRTWLELNDFYPKTVSLYHRQFGGLQLIMLIMIVLSVANAVNMNVFERTAEFGTARALGNRSSHIFQMVVLENTLLGLVGAVLGAIVGVALARGISAVGIPMPPPPNADLSYTAYVRVTAASVLVSSVIGFLATVLASIVPGLRVSAASIPEALRSAT